MYHLLAGYFTKIIEFIAFEFDDDYQVTLKETDKLLEDQVRNEEQNQELIDKAMPVLKGFMSAISE